jgi:hypothetical protein
MDRDETLRVDRQVMMMQTLALILLRTALVLTWLFSVGGALFALGYAFEDPGGWTAVLLAAAVVVPMALLTVLAVRSPHRALTVLTVAVGAFAVWAVVDVFVEIEMPAVPVIALLIAAPLAVVGQRYALHAGGLMFALAAIPFALVLVRLVRESGPEGPSLGALLGGSTGVVVVPLAVLAGLFALAGLLGRSAPAGEEPRPVEPAPPAAAARR